MGLDEILQLSIDLKWNAMKVILSVIKKKKKKWNAIVEVNSKRAYNYL